MSKQITYLCLLLCIGQGYLKPIFARSIHRPRDKSVPCVQTRWLGQSSPHYTLHGSHLEEYPLFRTFHKKHFKANLLPNKQISYRYDLQKTVDSRILKKKIARLLKEIHQKRKKFTDFIILSHRDFNFRRTFGLLILKFKDYPFVVKVSIETPQSFVRHNAKGFVPRFIYYMAGGINKHLLGFTRIRNLEVMKGLIDKNPYWSQHVTFPRKWYLLPRKTKWIQLTGINVGGKKKQKTAVPATYCVLSDWVAAERHTSMFSSTDRKECMKLCNYLELAIDPHINNFMIERTTKKIAIVDTEHFLTVVGLKEKKKFKSYFSWGTHLAFKCLNAMFFRTKDGRRIARLKESEAELRYTKT